MIHLVDLMLKVKAQAYLFEAANARHEHEYAVWDGVKLPPGKILVPGVVTHSTDEGQQPIDLPKLAALGEMVWPGGGGEEILRLVERVEAGRPINLGETGGPARERQ